MFKDAHPHRLGTRAGGPHADPFAYRTAFERLALAGQREAVPLDDDRDRFSARDDRLLPRGGGAGLDRHEQAPAARRRAADEYGFMRAAVPFERQRRLAARQLEPAVDRQARTALAARGRAGELRDLAVDAGGIVESARKRGDW